MLGTKSSFKLCSAVFISLKMRDYAKTYQSEGRCYGQCAIILDSAILSGASVCAHATLRDLTSPTLAYNDSMMNGYTDSDAHQ